jgi:hypothetical protein
MNEQKQMTWDDIQEMIAENTKGFAEIKQLQEETAIRMQETDRQMQETDKQIKETARQMKETDLRMDQRNKEANERLDKLGKHLGGVANSNGEMAEEFFYNSFNADKTFANERFDEIDRNLAYKRKDKKAEFDLVLFNGKSVALIEIKYNAKPDNIKVDKLIARIEIFKILYPEYQNHNIYLGVAALGFKEGLVETLHEAGIATIHQIGNKMIVYDKEVKVF